jgi:hypothetical protein
LLIPSFIPQTIKRNRHRAGRRKRERRERARLATEEAIRQFEELIGGPVDRGEPPAISPPVTSPGLAFAGLDLQDEDTVPYEAQQPLIENASTALVNQNLYPPVDFTDEEVLELLATIEAIPESELQSLFIDTH